MNPLTAKGQIQGAAHQGIGMALHEDLLYDRRSGQPLTAGYYGARIPTHLDAPDIEVMFIESDDGYGPFGAKSIGESGIILAPARGRQRDLQRDRPAHEGSADHARQDSGSARMKAFTNANARDARSTRRRSRGDARSGGRRRRVRRRRQRPAGAGQGAHHRARRHRQPQDDPRRRSGRRRRRRPDDRRLITLDALSRNEVVRRRYAVLAEAAGSVATPQIRNVGTLAGNVCQRPWCWYFRNGFPCYKAGGNQCFSFAGENQFHAIFGGGPSYIVHPSDTAPALVALDATFRIVGPGGERRRAGAEFFVLPRQNAAQRERPGRRRSARRRCRFRRPGRARAARITRCWTAKRGPTPSSARRSCSRWTRTSAAARAIVLGGVAPIPWRLPEVEKLLAGQRITTPTRRAGGRGRGRRRAAAVEERLQGAADPQPGAAHHHGTGRARLARR